MMIPSNAGLFSCAQTFGTPLEDAMRRDFTMNALFFNVNTSCIEDYSEMVRDPHLCVSKICER